MALEYDLHPLLHICSNWDVHDWDIQQLGYTATEIYNSQHAEYTPFSYPAWSIKILKFEFFLLLHKVTKLTCSHKAYSKVEVVACYSSYAAGVGSIEVFFLNVLFGRF